MVGVTTTVAVSLTVVESPAYRLEARIVNEYSAARSAGINTLRVA